MVSLIQLWLHSLFFIQSINFAISEYEAYVTKDGDFNTECTMQNPCGSLSFVLFNIGTYHMGAGTRTIFDEHVTIYVDGHFSIDPSNFTRPNKVSSAHNYYDWKWILLCYPFIDTSITVIFNQSIQSAHDWYPLLPWCLQNTLGYWYIFQHASKRINSLWTTSHAVEFQNLIYENTTFWLIDMISDDFSGAFHCKQCVFRNLITDITDYSELFQPAFMKLGHNVVFQNCTFTNIVVSPQFGSDDITTRYKPSDWLSFIRILGSANFSDCQFGHISAIGDRGYFISTTLNDDIFKFIHFQRIVVNNSVERPDRTTRFVHANYEGNKFNSHSNISITDSCFYGPLNIIYIHNGEYFVDINDVHIESTQYIHHDTIISGQTESMGAFTKSFYNSIHIKYGATLSLNNIYYQSQLTCSWYRMCYYIYKGPPPTLLLPFCQAPVGLLYNEGKTAAHNVMLSSNYNNKYKSYLEYGVGMFYARTEYFDNLDFYCDWKDKVDLSYLSYFSSFYNDALGELNMENITFRNGAHNNILRNFGVATIHNISTGSDGNDYLSNPWNLNPLTLFENFGDLSITNSKLQMSDIAAFELHSGSLNLTNSTISHCSFAIHSIGTAEHIYLDSVSISQTGLYTMQPSMLYYGTDSYFVSPVYISSKHTSITNCNFHYISPFGIMEFANINNDEESEIILNNNNFLITGYTDFTSIHTNILRLSAPYPINAATSRTESLWKSFIYQINQMTQWHQDKGYIIVSSPYYIALNHNTFLYDSQHLSNITDLSTSILQYPMPWLYITTSTDNCMASNIFFNYGILVERGRLLSCAHPNILNYSTFNKDCFPTLGTPSDAFAAKTQFIYDPSLFNSIGYAIMIDSTSSHMLLDSVQFIDYNTSPIVIARKDINIVISMVDTMLINNKTDTSLLVPEYCTPICYQIVDNDTNKIRQLKMECVEEERNGTYVKIEDLAYLFDISESLSYWSASTVYITENVTLYPGGRINFSFSILDEYGNKVSKYSYPIRISLVYDEFNINFVMTIDANGKCDICDTGLYVEGININNTGSFIINTLVEDKSLTVNNINVSIIECPAGFGVFGSAQQCALCERGTYSIHSNKNPCQECDANLPGLSCLGSNAIIVDFNYWIMINEYEKSSYIITARCPDGFCCLSDGCDFLRDELCATNRDPSQYLCGKCIDTYSEVFGTTHCAICDRH
eukprot:186572_1